MHNNLEDGDGALLIVNNLYAYVVFFGDGKCIRAFVVEDFRVIRDLEGCKIMGHMREVNGMDHNFWTELRNLETMEAQDHNFRKKLIWKICYIGFWKRTGKWRFFCKAGHNFGAELEVLRDLRRFGNGSKVTLAIINLIT
jgi:hypothetical protein